jgi:hypothetical protein
MTKYTGRIKTGGTQKNAINISPDEEPSKRKEKITEKIIQVQNQNIDLDINAIFFNLPNLPEPEDFLIIIIIIKIKIVERSNPCVIAVPSLAEESSERSCALTAIANKEYNEMLSIVE